MITAAEAVGVAPLPEGSVLAEAADGELRPQRLGAAVWSVREAPRGGSARGEGGGRDAAVSDPRRVGRKQPRSRARIPSRTPLRTPLAHAPPQPP